MNDKRYWVGFNLVKGIGAVGLQALREHFGDLAVAWQAPVDALQAAGLSSKSAERVSAALVMMEPKGLVRQLGGMNYVAVREQQTEYKV